MTNEFARHQRTVQGKRGTAEAARKLPPPVPLQQHQNIEQYALLAQFGQYVLGYPPYEELIERLVATVRAGMPADCCQLLLKALSSSQPTLIAGYGHDLEVPGEGRSIEVQINGKEDIHGTLRAWMRNEAAASAGNAAFLHGLADTVSAYMERKSAEDKLAYMAQFDALTGLPNRTLYLDRLAHAIDAAARDSTSVAVLFVDIDRFKSVNDTLGHAVGDELLVQIASRLKSLVRSGDSIGRLSGDEFALVLSELTQDDRAAVIGKKITAALSTPFSIQGHTVYVSGSVGISLYPTDGAAPEALLKHADMAMYRAKQSGPGRYQFYKPELQRKALARVQLENKLREALDKDQFELWYQPKVDLRTGELSGLEALLRWRTDDGEVVEPSEFIAVLEDTGLIIPVGEKVVAMACQQLRAWQDAGCAPPSLALNVSPRQFQQENLDDTLTRPILDSGIDPQMIEFELTESMLMRDAEGAIRTLKRIKSHGVRLALDDFGTGYSSLHYLKLFPLDSLKIDREFIHDMLDDANNARIVAAIVSLGRNLNMMVVAEGVETARQLAFLRRQGCNEAQGFGLSRPLPADEMTDLLEQGRRWNFVRQPVPQRQIA